MNKKFKWLIALAGAALLIIAIAVPILAAGPLSGNADQNSNGQIGYGNCSGLGIGISDSVTGLLGLTEEQIQAERQAGKSLVQVAAAKGVTEEALINAIMTEKQTALQAMVTAGTISQTIADQRLEQMRVRVQEAVNSTDVGPQSWCGANENGQNGGYGMMGQGNGQLGPGMMRGVTGTRTGTGGMMRGGWNNN